MSRNNILVLAVPVTLVLLLGACSVKPAPAPPPMTEIRDAAQARDAALVYLETTVVDGVPEPGGDWATEDVTSPALVGTSTLKFTKEGWQVNVSYPIVLPENTIYTVTVLNLQVGWRWQGTMDFPGKVTELSLLQQITEEASQEVALDFVKNDATFRFDGIEATLKLVETTSLSRCPFCWAFTCEFDSANAGYGDRTGQMLAQVITTHRAVIVVEQLVVTSAVMDEVWDMMQQKEIDASPRPPSGVPAAPNDSIVTAKVIDVIATTGNFPWELVIEIQSSEDVPGFGNFTKERVGETISVRTQEDISQLEKGQIITAHVRLQGDEWTRVLIATDIKQQPIEIIAVVGPLQPINPGGPIVEITLKNMADEPIVSLTATLELIRCKVTLRIF